MSVKVTLYGGKAVEFSNYTFNEMTNYCKAYWGESFKASDLIAYLKDPSLKFVSKKQHRTVGDYRFLLSIEYWVTVKEWGKLLYICPVCLDPTTGVAIKIHFEEEIQDECIESSEKRRIWKRPLRETL